MRWDLAKGVRAELHFFSGLSFSGQRETCRVFHDQRRQGDDIDGSRTKSFGIIADYGTRITLITANDPDGWEELPWRSVVVLPGTSFTSKSGTPAVQIPNVDAMDPPDAVRTDLELVTIFPLVDRLADGKTWTYGRIAPNLPIRCNVRAIRMDRV